MNSVFVKNILFPLQEYLLGRSTFKYLAELEKIQWYSTADIHRYQLKKLHTLSVHCYQNVPYYTGVFNSLKLNPADIKTFEGLRKLPFLTKKIIRENPDSLKAKNMRNSLVRMNTGGSTGEPLIFYVDKRRQAYDKASAFRAKRWWGIDIGEKEIALWGSPIEITKQDRMKDFRDRITNTKLLSAFDMKEESMFRYIEVIQSYKPKHMFGYPSSIYLLANFCKHKNIDMKNVGIKVIFVTGELLYDYQKNLIQEIFGCTVANGYGGRDGGFIAHECPNGNMHITEDILVEIIKDDRVPAKEGETGEIVVTHLDNFGMPFIRYRMGDMGKLSNKRCACGRATPILEAIEGRATDFIVTPDGKTLHALALIYVLRDIEGIEQFKIIQETKDYLEIKIIRNGKFSLAGEKIIDDKIKKLLGNEVKIAFDYEDFIESEKSGKYRYVVSKVAQ